MIVVRKSEDRGHADYGWLKTYHTFSFNRYYDERFIRFRDLRVINEDRVQPGKGFGTHPHDNMEIITYVLDGALEHKDSMGNGSIIYPGEVQRMSAGTGITHSEFNSSNTEEVHLLQIWILPDKQDIEPSYEQKSFDRNEMKGRFRILASPEGADGSVTINQDARMYASIVSAGESVEFPVKENRHVWIQVARGEVMVDDLRLKAGDGAAIDDDKEIVITGVKESEVLLFDLK